MRKMIRFITVSLLTACLLAGCGQNSSKNYEKDNSVAGSESSTTTESSNPTADESSSSSTSEVKKDADGKYVYNVSGIECKTSINVDDYIYAKDGKQYFDVEKMIEDAGWKANKYNGKWSKIDARYSGNGYEASIIIDDESEAKNTLGAYQIEYEVFTFYGPNRSSAIGTPLGFNSMNTENAKYFIESLSHDAVSYNQIALFACGLDNMKNSTDDFIVIPANFEQTMGGSYTIQ